MPDKEECKCGKGWAYCLKACWVRVLTLSGVCGALETPKPQEKKARPCRKS